MNSFKVINWDFNTGKIQYYDVMPYLINQYEKEKKKPSTFNEFKEFVKQKGMYMFWSRCEYEVIVSSWPPGRGETKIDIWNQIENNLDLVTKLLIENIKLQC